MHEIMRYLLVMIHHVVLMYNPQRSTIRRNSFYKIYEINTCEINNRYISLTYQEDKYSSYINFAPFIKIWQS